MHWPWRGRVTADTQNWLELAGTGATGVKQCIHYDIPEKSRSIMIVGGANLTVCGKKRKGTGKSGNSTGKSDIITCCVRSALLAWEWKLAQLRDVVRAFCQ